MNHSSDNLNLAVTRLAHPLAFAAYLKHLGAPIDRYFQRQRLPALCDNPSAFVPVVRAWGLFNDVALRESRMVGWHVGKYAGDRGLSSGLLKKLETAPSLYGALKVLIRLVSTESSHLKLGILERKEKVFFYTHCAGMKEVPGYLVSQAYQLAVYCDLVRHFAGAGWSPAEIGIESPDYPKVLREHFAGSRVRVNQPCGYITIPRSSLYQKICTHHYLGSQYKLPPLTSRLNYAEKLALMLEAYLPNGYLSLSFVASLADCSERTLSRRLASSGTHYQALLDGVRFNKAMTLLAELERPVSDVARFVGFAQQANFTRMFRRIGGLSPRQYRRNLIDPHN